MFDEKWDIGEGTIRKRVEYLLSKNVETIDVKGKKMKQIVKGILNGRQVKVVERRDKISKKYEEVQEQIAIELQPKVLYTDTDNLIEILTLEGGPLKDLRKMKISLIPLYNQLDNSLEFKLNNIRDSNGESIAFTID